MLMWMPFLLLSAQSLKEKFPSIHNGHPESYQPRLPFIEYDILPRD